MSTAPKHSLDIQTLYKVAGQTVLITGGAAGIGRMFTEAFVRNGALVYIASRNAKQCEQTAREMTAMGPGESGRVIREPRASESISFVWPTVLTRPPFPSSAGLCHAVPADLSSVAACNTLADKLKEKGVSRR